MPPVDLVCQQSPLPSQLEKPGFDFGIVSATRLPFALVGPGAVVFRSGDHVSPDARRGLTPNPAVSSKSDHQIPWNFPERN